MATPRKRLTPRRQQTGDSGRRWLGRLRGRARSPAFLRYVRELLLELCRIDTTPKSDVSQMRAAEDACFRILERELQALALPDARLERRPVCPAIQDHPAYSLLHFTKTPERPEGLSAEKAYTNRANLVYVLPGMQRSKLGQSLALNAHLDVVAPYFPPYSKGGSIFGRGACDDKGPVVSVVAALKLTAELLDEAGITCNRNLAAMFVVEEETGGNGSLSLALDRQLKSLYDSILVCECTGLKIHPANRGAVWYRARLSPLPGVSPLELYAFINEEMEKEGLALRAESRHDLFPQRPVQTCHGIIGPFGEHPSRICGEVAFVIACAGPPDKALEYLVRDCLDFGLAGYIGIYGDKTKVVEPHTRKPLISRHYDLRLQGNTVRVAVHGATGHMGAIRERDGAITKMAHLVRSLVVSKARLESLAGGPVRIELAANADAPPAGTAELNAEGGQGFVPTHRIEEVMERLRLAAQRGAENYLRRLDRPEKGDQVVEMTYEKLHNAAFAGDPNSDTMHRALAAARLCRLMNNEPVLGWTVSCDARLFATEYPDMPVLTFGPGQLAWAHSDQEQIELHEIIQAAEFLALFVLMQTGTIVVG
jgi:acetylornithine deacetylase/succinyl-diaminopimelate desuccinylase-like protein